MQHRGHDEWRGMRGVPIIQIYLFSQMLFFFEDCPAGEGSVDHGNGDQDCTQPPVLADQVLYNLYTAYSLACTNRSKCLAMRSNSKLIESPLLYSKRFVLECVCGVIQHVRV